MELLSRGRVTWYDIPVEIRIRISLYAMNMRKWEQNKLFLESLRYSRALLDEKYNMAMRKMQGNYCSTSEDFEHVREIRRGLRRNQEKLIRAQADLKRRTRSLNEFDFYTWPEYTK